MALSHSASVSLPLKYRDLHEVRKDSQAKVQSIPLSGSSKGGQWLSHNESNLNHQSPAPAVHHTSGGHKSITSD